jgi:hypothetical protein
MKRVLIFALLGPPLGLLVGLWVMLPILNWAVGGTSVFDYHQIVLLPLSYLVGILPACLAGLFDEFLARWRVRYSMLWTTLFGFAVSFLPLVSSYTHGFIHGLYVLLFGFVGAAPAAACSWITLKTVRPSTTG